MSARDFALVAAIGFGVFLLLKHGSAQAGQATGAAYDTYIPPGYAWSDQAQAYTKTMPDGTVRFYV